MYTAIIAGGYAVLRFIGRWVLGALSNHGRGWSLRYLRKGAAKFRKRAEEYAKAGRNWLAKFNAGRAHRWEAAYKWVAKHWFRLTRKGAAIVEEKVRDRIPFQVPDFEDYDTWHKTLEGAQVLAHLKQMGATV